MTIAATVKMQCSIVEQEIRAVTYTSPSGPKHGYEWRLLVWYPATPKSRARTAWTKWVFGSHQEVEKMLAQWQEFLGTHGHLAQTAPPGSSVQ